MLLRTFQHLQGIGVARERALWASGIRSWSDLIEKPARSPGLAPYSTMELRWMREEIGRDLAAWSTRDAAWFASRFKRSLCWRAVSAFRSGLAYFDLEADGPDPRTARLTVATLASERDGIQVFCSGFNLDDLPQALAGLDGLITFGGQAFDLPLLQTTFGPDCLPPLAIDLRWLCRQAGFPGGLKAIEARLGLKRPASIAALRGRAAISLWQAHQRGTDPDALVRLITYNAFDAIHLRPVTDRCLERLVTRAFPEAEPADVVPGAAIPGERDWGEASAREIVSTCLGKRTSQS